MPNVTALITFLFVLMMGSAPLAAVDAVYQQDEPYRGPYFGQVPPGLEPEIFAPGIVSTAAEEGCIVFSADGRRVVFRRLGDANLILEGADSESGWRIFSIPDHFGRLDWYHGDFTLGPDGEAFYFSSTRPIHPAEVELDYPSIWVTSWSESGWGEALPLPEIVRSSMQQGYPTVTRDGTLYFFARDSEAEAGDIYEARYVDGEYQEPRNLGSPVNSEYHEVDPYVSPDGSYMIFMAYLRPGVYGGGDLYVSFKGPGGSWSEPVNMGDSVNSPADENRPFVTVDGKYFFFTSNKEIQTETMGDLRPDRRPGNGSRDIYWVDAAIIERLRIESGND